MACQNPLTTDQIRKILTEHANQTMPSSATVSGRRAAVLVPILCREDGWHILYTRRSEYVNDHKGQVSFPGGAVDPIDRSVEETALREVREEIGIDPQKVEILGRLDDIISISNYIITPVIGQLRWPIALDINPREVSRVFSIPLTWLSTPEHYESRMFNAPNGRRELVYFFDPYDSEQLWGISARITLQLLEVLGLLNDRSSLPHSQGSG